MKYLIVGLGNIGNEYANTRHNIGFKALDYIAAEEKLTFTDQRYGAIAEYKFKGRTFILLKPSTYMNLSGNAIRYWLQKENIPMENMLVILDDLNLPFGTIRIRKKGSDGGHNGLSNIAEVIGTTEYYRVRFGIGSEFSKGQQVNFVLGEWSEEEKNALPERNKIILQIVKSFATIGIDRTMNSFNNK